MTFFASTDRAERIEKIVSLFEKAPAGNVVEFEKIGSATGVDILQRRDLMQGAIQKLRKLGIEISNVRGVGYRKNTGTQTVAALPQQFTHMRRTARKTEKMASNAIAQNLNGEDFRVANSALAKAGAIADLAHSPKVSRINPAPTKFEQELSRKRGGPK